MMGSLFRPTTLAAVVLAALIGVALAGLGNMGPALGAQTLGGPERFAATAINLERGGTAGLEIVINRWSTDAERNRLLSVLFDKGQDKLVDALQDTPKVGYIRNPAGGLGWDLHYARHAALPDGGERVTAVTDRPISFREQANLARTLDYPFTVIELQVNADGEGDGKISAAAKITGDKESGTIVVENWGIQPIQLTAVKRERTTH